ncbi:hypothetical protein KORDIASMS9_02745 [Kordia sp. SMS9]|uniref:hypothetical protein n=1 Tax=Kordia sp. SMS9 TaxID=2282170 RepID=UPI000E0D6CA5|nr:hypothetical protein [Kordia sp. SMS9]AXG70505.1 hypothetical protein KORDIASMS9_02745 [Kordia sp. SMS9]
MQFSAIMAYFLSITLYVILTYNFLKTVFFCFQKELLTENRNIRRFQQFLLVLLFICMMVYHKTAKTELEELSILPWIWGFLSGHLFVTRKKHWINELLGLGILLAITIVLFFKQTEIVQLFTEEAIANVLPTIYLVYMSLGFVLGVLLWSNSSSAAKN